MARKRSNRHNQLVRECIKLLKAYGGYGFSSDAGNTHRSGGRYTGDGPPPGWPDITGYTVWGQFIGIEVKIGKDKLRPDQDVWRQVMVMDNCAYVLCRDSVDELEKFLNANRSKQCRSST